MDTHRKRTLDQPIEIRPLAPADLATADRVMRVAFGTFLGLPDPMQFMGDAAYVANRYRSDPTSAFAAVRDGEVVGSNFATRWGSVGFFGPLTVRPDLWDAGIGRRLMEPVLERFAAWNVTHAGLFTFPSSPKHLGLYESLGFWPRHLTFVMTAPASSVAPAPPLACMSQLDAGERAARIGACRELTNAIYPGLDLAFEIEAVQAHGFGDTVLLEDGRETSGFAVCHVGPGTEAGGGTCYVKFGAVRSGAGASKRLERLLDACSAFALSRGVQQVVAGVNAARHEAYRVMQGRGFKKRMVGVTMHRPNDPGYSKPDAFVLDDWR